MKLSSISLVGATLAAIVVSAPIASGPRSLEQLNLFERDMDGELVDGLFTRGRGSHMSQEEREVFQATAQEYAHREIARSQAVDRKAADKAARKAAHEQKAAYRKAAYRKAADRKAADRKAADRKAAHEQKAAEAHHQAADREAAHEQKAAEAHHQAADREAAHEQKAAEAHHQAADRKAAHEQKAAQHEAHDNVHLMLADSDAHVVAGTEHNVANLKHCEAFEKTNNDWHRQKAWQHSKKAEHHYQQREQNFAAYAGNGDAQSLIEVPVQAIRQSAADAVLSQKYADDIIDHSNGLKPHPGVFNEPPNRHPIHYDPVPAEWIPGRKGRNH